MLEIRCYCYCYCYCYWHRQVAAISFKNLVKKNWEPASEGAAHQIPEDDKAVGGAQAVRTRTHTTNQASTQARKHASTQARKHASTQACKHASTHASNRCMSVDRTQPAHLTTHPPPASADGARQPARDAHPVAAHGAAAGMAHTICYVYVCIKIRPFHMYASKYGPLNRL
jgi:hypothetical protein